MNRTYVKEIFTSIQGEGLYVGEMQIFVRFCRCNLCCKYCDTKFKKDKNTILYTPDKLAEELLHNEVRSVSLTGGEPLLEVDFLKDFLPLIKKQKKINLETNGTLAGELSQIIDYIDVVAADIKLQSAAKQKNQFLLNDEFLNIARKKDCFIKVVFDENIEKEEITQVIKIAKKYNLPIIIQPMMNKNKFSSNTSKFVEIFNIFYKIYPYTRLIPQTHKFLNVT